MKGNKACFVIYRELSYAERQQPQQVITPP